MGRFTGVLGLLTMLGLAYAFSTNRRAINKKTVAWGLGLQVVFSIFVLKIEIGRILFQKAGDAVNWLLSFAFKGSQFVFGDLGAQHSPMGIATNPAHKTSAILETTRRRKTISPARPIRLSLNMYFASARWRPQAKAGQAVN